MSAAAFAALALGLAAAEPAAARADAPPADFCSILKGIIAAEDQPSPFASLVIAAGHGNMEWSKLVIPGYDYCAVQWIERGRAVRCSRNLAPPTLTADNLIRDTEACLGVKQTPTGEREYGSRNLAFEYKAVQIFIDEQCTDACHVGRRVTYSIEARRKP